MLRDAYLEELASGAYGIARPGLLLNTVTTFRLGGPCDLALEPTSCKEVIRAIRYLRAKDIPFFLMGKGSNLLVRDGGLDGVLVQLGSKFSDLMLSGDSIRAQAGVPLAKLALASFAQGLSGMEGLAGIPGSLGGAVTMNAGAYGYEMGDILQSVQVLDRKGELLTLTGPEMGLGYRTSRMMEEGMVVLEATVKLRPDSKEAIFARYQDFMDRRRSKQPLDKASAGSTFKRPEGYFAGKLIEEAGLRGYRIGDAQVSEKHCGFVINRGHARAAEVLELIGYIQKTVKEKFAVDLEPEVRIIGKED